MAMRIGLDFDGTVALYDETFHRCAVERFQMPAEIEPQKLAIRDWFWRTPLGRGKWIELQGLVYGVRMNEARLAPGLEDFLLLCRKWKIEISIISHKTEYPVAGPPVNLRATARGWLEQVGFHDALGVPPEAVFFEATRAAKIERIVSERCAAFVDDLEEVFLESTFPTHVEKLLYAPSGQEHLKGDIRVFPSWQAIGNHLSRTARCLP